MGFGSKFSGSDIFPISHDGHAALGLSSLPVVCPEVHHASLLGREAMLPGDALLGSSMDEQWIWPGAQPQSSSCLVI